jgi:hypothetical protein
MKRLLLGVTIFAAAIVLAGCPIYSSGGNYRVCDSNGCWDCPDRTYSDACIAWTCATDSDCGPGYSCNATGTCVLPTSPPEAQDSGGGPPAQCRGPNDCGSGSVCGRDDFCHQGDCGSWGCPAGYTCLISFGYASCTVGIPTHDGGSLDASTDSSVSYDASDAASLDSGDSGASDAADASDANRTIPCNSDLDCGGAGARCVNGACAARSSLCSDSTQCSSGDLCVAGLCAPQCSSGGSCPVGFDCDLTNDRNVCSLGGCSTTNDCFNGGVCVEGHCAQRCTASDASTCPAGELCINGGCIPDQHATFDCTNNGNSGSLANTCSANSICLHHDCYTACGLGDGADGCQPGQVCTVVQTPQGTSFHVCGTGSNLGSACDPAAADAPRCAEGQVCIDGYCR